MQQRFFPTAEGLYKAFVAALSTLMIYLSLLATGKNQGFWALVFGSVSVVNLLVKSCPKLQYTHCCIKVYLKFTKLPGREAAEKNHYQRYDHDFSVNQQFL